MEVSKDDVHRAAARGAPDHVLRGLLTRWAGWRGEAVVGRKVEMCLADDDLVDLGLLCWVPNTDRFRMTKLFELGLGWSWRSSDASRVDSSGWTPRVIQSTKDEFITAFHRILDAVQDLGEEELLRIPKMELNFYDCLSSVSLKGECRPVVKITIESDCGWIVDKLNEGFFPCVHTIDVREVNSVTDSVWERLCTTISDGSVPCLETLEFSGDRNVDIGPEKSVVLGQAIGRGSLPAIKTLDFSGNYEFGNDGCIALMNAILNGSIPNLETLSFEYVISIEAPAVAAIAEAIGAGAMPNLRKLDLGMCDDNLLPLVQILKIGTVPHLQVLNLSDRHLNTEDYLEIAEAISIGALASLEELYIGAFSDTDTGKIAMFRAFSGGFSRKLRVFVSHAINTSEGCTALIDMVARGGTPALMKLRIRQCFMDDSGCMALAQALANDKAPNLRELTLRSVAFGDRGSSAIANVLLDGAVPDLKILEIFDDGYKKEKNLEFLEQLRHRRPFITCPRIY